MIKNKNKNKKQVRGSAVSDQEAALVIMIRPGGGNTDDKTLKRESSPRATQVHKPQMQMPPKWNAQWVQHPAGWDAQMGSPY